MNIFFLDKSPEKSAEFLCDKHIPKMLLESCQMLSTAVRKYEEETNSTPLAEPIYKSAYPNHPMTKWVCETKDNFDWTLDNALAIYDEYKLRFNKIHKSYKVLKNILNGRVRVGIKKKRKYYYLEKVIAKETDNAITK